ncbi:M15 family metallopeptidase [Rufibacter roseus]|uniref:D-alanyl-D-alanine dipeptidase n=1 Tax=Rufibacter roseus TaxID=1567108 RepID=A0ABW2DI46_9BACT|nr:M15 family metallopeptidase [Rufibacter roseus]
MLKLYRKWWLFLFSLLVSQYGLQAFGQTNFEKYRLKTVSDLTEYEALVRQDSSVALVALKQYIPNIQLDIRYATSNNLMGEPMYQSAGAFLSLPAAKALQAVQEELKKQGVGLKIYDAYRPYAVTVAFYEKVRDTVFVASPYRGSRHNRGCAVDLTLVDLKTGKELKMPTPFDEFSPQAHSQYAKLPKKVLKNRQLLQEVMLKHGFEIYPDEWWHFDFSGWKEHPVMDISFEELNKTKQ